MALSYRPVLSTVCSVTLLALVPMSSLDLVLPVRRNVSDPVSPTPTGFRLMVRRTLFTAPSLLVANVRTTDPILLGPGSASGLRSTSRLCMVLGTPESRPYVTLFRTGLK